MKNNKTLNISNKLSENGFNITVGNRSCQLKYPENVWHALPPGIRKEFADTLTYASTFHLAYANFDSNFLLYNFPPPQIESLFFKSALYCLSEDNSPEYKTSDYIRLLFNSFPRISFTKRPQYPQPAPLPDLGSKNVIVPFTFGKDSLLTYCLCKELGFKPYLYYFLEPLAGNENKYKYKLIKQFADLTEDKLNLIPFTAGKFRTISYKTGWWGWDILLAQYALYLLPYLLFHRAPYIFWSDEAGCQNTYTDKEGFVICPSFEQNQQWLLQINSSFNTFAPGHTQSSLIEPLNDLAIIGILHSRYPQFARLQHSCPTEESKKQFGGWCGNCFVCSRMFLFLKANGINPASVGLTTDMFQASKRRLYSIFFTGSRETSTFTTESIDEQLLGFYMACKRGAKGSLIDEFRKTKLDEAKSKRSALTERFLTCRPSISIPDNIRPKLDKIFEPELAKIRAAVLS